jgi:UDP-N-acetylglucosamine--N-acetylmuramyl-(pentapeptide) pyrophosphoryl-undecaprenol N-acetylglucosamine transferase
MSNRIVITGGHLTPALALIEEIKKDKTNWEIHYLGRKYAFEKQKSESFEYRLLNKREDIIFHPLLTGRLQRKFKLETIISLLKIPIGFCQSLLYLLKIKPDKVVSFGGYLSVPVIINSWLLGIPSFTHEQTSTLGLANKINSFFVKKFAVSFPWVKHLVPKNKAVLTGNLISQNIYNSQPPEESQLSKIVSSADKPILLITGGKTGSRTINQTVKQALPLLTKDFFVIHQIGLDRTMKPKRVENYWATRFIDHEYIGWLLKRTDLVISRSGANIVCELASLKQPAVLIPIPWTSQNEQYKNAKFLEQTGLAEILNQQDLTPQSLIKTINEFNYQQVKPDYPDWWDQANPAKAAEQFWDIIKSEDDD